MPFELSTTIAGRGPLARPEIERIAHAGFLTIDLSLPSVGLDPAGDGWIAGVRQSAAAVGLEIGGLCVGWALRSGALERAGSIGAKRVTLIADACRAHGSNPGTPPDPDKVGRALDALALEASQRGLALAVEFPRAFAPGTVVDLIDAIEGGPVGVCLDVGHANLGGDAPEAIEQLSGYVTVVHLHDNQGRDDSHRAPYSGSVDWPLTLMALWKTGFTGPSVIETMPDPDLATSLTRAVGARTRLQAILDDLAQPMVFPEA